MEHERRANSLQKYQAGLEASAAVMDILRRSILLCTVRKCLVTGKYSCHSNRSL